MIDIKFLFLHLEIIKFAEVTKSLLKSPNTFTAVRKEVPLDILVQDEHTGAIKWREPGVLCRARRIASLCKRGHAICSN